MMSSSEKNGPITLSCVSAHHAFTLELSRSCSKCYLGSLRSKVTSYADWQVQRCEILPHQWRLKKLSCTKICSLVCVANCDLSCLSRDVSSWTTSNSYSSRRKLFRRILWTVVRRIFNSVLALEIDLFGLRAKACLTRSTSSSDLLGRSVEWLFSTLPVSLRLRDTRAFKWRPLWRTSWHPL
jgi:hypothetical protein